MIDTHTTRQVRPINLFMFFLALGRVTALSGIDPVLLYQISQVITGAFLFIVTYWFIRQILPKTLHTLSVLFILGVETGPYLASSTLQNITEWVPSFELQHHLMDRHFGLPHHTFALAMGLLFLGIFFRLEKKFSITGVLTLAISAFIGMTVMPAYIMTLALTVFLPWTLWSIFHKSFRKYFIPAAVTAGIMLITGTWLTLETAKSPPWSYFTATENSWWANDVILTRYTSSLIPYYPFLLLFIIGTAAYWKVWNSDIRKLSILMTTWIILPAVYIPFSKLPFFPIVNARLVDGYQYVPAGILSALGVYYFLKTISSIKIRQWISASIIVLVLAGSITLTAIYTHQTLRSQEAFWGNVYPLRTTWDGVLYMNRLPVWSGVMVREFYGEILPAFGTIRSFIGGPHGWTDWPERQWLANRFFSGELPYEEAVKLLSENDISYVFHGPDEQSLTTTGNFYPNILTSVFHNSSVTIYKVNR